MKKNKEVSLASVNFGRYFDLAPFLQCLTDLDGNIQFCNRAWKDLLGYDSDEIQNKNFLTLLNPEDIEFHSFVSKQLSDKKPQLSFVSRIINKAGNYVLFEWLINLSDNLLYIAAKDISGYKKKELLLIERNQILGEINHYSSELNNLSYEIIYPYIVSEIKRMFKYVSVFISIFNDTNATLELKESTLNQSDSQYLSSLLKKDIGNYSVHLNKDNYEKLILENVRQSESLSSLAFREISDELNEIMKQKFDIKFFLSISLKIRNKLVGVIVCTGDDNTFIADDDVLLTIAGITANTIRRKQAEEDIVEKSNRLNAILQTIPDMLFIINREGYLTEYHASDINKLYLEPGKIKGTHLSKIFDYNETQRIIEAYTLSLETGRVTKVEYELSINHTTNYFEAKFSAIDDDHVIAAIRDVSDYKKIISALKESEDRYKVLVDNANDMIIVTSSEGQLYYTNPSTSNITGFKQEELLNKNFMEFIHDEDAMYAKNIYNEFIKNGKLKEKIIFRIRDKQGIEKWIELRPVLIKWNDEIAVLNFISDVTQRIKSESALRESESLLRTITDSAKDAIIVINDEGKVVYWNPGAEKMFGYGTDEITGKIFHEKFVPPEYLPFHNKGFEQFSKTGKGTVLGNSTDTVIKKKDGEILTVSLSISGVLIKEKWHAVGILRDITERKKYEEEIKNKNEELNKINLEKDKFFSIIAHDLKSPFQGFLGLTKFMVEESQDFTLEEFARLSKSLYNSASSLYSLLDNLLQWSRSQRGLMPFEPESIRLNYAIKICIDYLSTIAIRKEIEIINYASSDIYIYADANMLNTVLRNLLSNAIKFSHRKGIVEISAKKENCSISVSIKDNGIGISEKDKSKLFNIDSKVSNPGTEGEQSAGLGLILCKEFISKHNGQIKVESEINKGSIFTFSLPVNNTFIPVYTTEEI